ncbi:MAG: hypothetical protein WD200_02790 [Candidatus Andersenbacteria bacterium]
MSLFIGKIQGLNVKPCAAALGAFDKVCEIVEFSAPDLLGDVEFALRVEDLCLAVTQRRQIVSAAIVEDTPEECFIPFLFSNAIFATKPQEVATARLIRWIIWQYQFKPCIVRLVEQDESFLHKKVLRSLGFSFAGTDKIRCPNGEDLWWCINPIEQSCPWHPKNRVGSYYGESSDLPDP